MAIQIFNVGELATHLAVVNNSFEAIISIS